MLIFWQAEETPSVRYYLLLAAGLVPLLLLPALLEPLEPEKSLVMSSETSGSSGLGFSMFMDCSISCEDGSKAKTVGWEQTMKTFTESITKMVQKGSHFNYRGTWTLSFQEHPLHSAC